MVLAGPGFGLAPPGRPGPGDARRGPGTGGRRARPGAAASEAAGSGRSGPAPPQEENSKLPQHGRRRSPAAAVHAGMMAAGSRRRGPSLPRPQRLRAASEGRGPCGKSKQADGRPAPAADTQALAAEPEPRPGAGTGRTSARGPIVNALRQPAPRFTAAGTRVGRRRPRGCRDGRAPGARRREPRPPGLAGGGAETLGAVLGLRSAPRVKREPGFALPSREVRKRDPPKGRDGTRDAAPKRRVSEPLAFGGRGEHPRTFEGTAAGSVGSVTVRVGRGAEEKEGGAAARRCQWPRSAACRQRARPPGEHAARSSDAAQSSEREAGRTRTGLRPEGLPGTGRL